MNLPDLKSKLCGTERRHRCHSVVDQMEGWRGGGDSSIVTPWSLVDGVAYGFAGRVGLYGVDDGAKFTVFVEEGSPVVLVGLVEEGSPVVLVGWTGVV